MSELLVIAGGAAPVYLLDRIALYLQSHVVTQGVRSIGDVGIVFAFVLFAIAVAIGYIVLIQQLERKINARSKVHRGKPRVPKDPAGPQVA